MKKEKRSLLFLNNSHLQKILVLSFCFSYFSISHAQHFIGISGGYSLGTFTNFVKKQNYDAKYHFKKGVALSFFYETKLDSMCNLVLETQYKWQNADMRIDYNFGHSSFYKNVNYSFHLLTLNLICSFQLVEKKAFKLYFLLGPTFAFNVNTTAKGWEYYPQSPQKDTNSFKTLPSREYIKNERNSKDLSVFNAGIDLGLNFIIPINKKMDFLIQNRYNFFFTNITKQKNHRYTSLFSGCINIGFRYRFQ